MSQLGELSQRWQARWLNHINTDVIRNRSELLTAASNRLILESEKVSKRMQQDAKNELAQRVRDIVFLKDELEQSLEEVIVETDTLIIFKVRVESALAAYAYPLKVSINCLEERMKYSRVEYMHDEVERALINEKEVTEQVMVLLKRMLEQITEQIRLNRSAKYHLQKDVRDKFVAQNIDDTCALMTENDFSNDQRPNDNIALPRMALNPEEWKNFSDVNMTKAMRQKANSMSLRALVDSLLERTAADMEKSFQVTNSAFCRKVQETKTSKEQMEEHLHKVVSELASQERNMEALRLAIAEKEVSLKVAQGRLSTRGQRPGMEQCHDQSQARLLSEVRQLTTQIKKMHDTMAQSEIEQRNLLQCQLELQENIELKTIALYIDQVICAQLREPVVIRAF